VEKYWDNIFQKMGVNYHATMEFIFRINKKNENGIVFTILGLITMVLP